MPPPGTPKSGEFRKNGTIRRFLRPIRAPLSFFTPVIQIRANRRNWTGDLLPDRTKVGWIERKGCFGGGGVTSERAGFTSVGMVADGHLLRR